MADSVEGLTVIFPVASPATNLAQSLSPWLGVLSQINRPHEVFLVADGLTPELGDAIEKIVATNKNVRMLSLDKPTGYGACIRLGLAEATQPLVFYSALNEGWNPSDLPRLLKSIEFKDEYTDRYVELVNGHRRGIAVPAGVKWRRRIFGFGFRVLFGTWPDPSKGYLGSAEARYWYRARLQFGLRLGDINSKFKLFRRSALSRIVIQSNGDFVNTEILAKANFLGTLMDEVPLSDKCVPGAIPDMSADRKAVFAYPKFKTTKVESSDQPPASASAVSAEPVPAA